eukprot:scaffold310891_cov35-Prasinocladus_malaysianus.AAC.2
MSPHFHIPIAQRKVKTTSAYIYIDLSVASHDRCQDVIFVRVLSNVDTDGAAAEMIPAQCLGLQCVGALVLKLVGIY